MKSQLLGFSVDPGSGGGSERCRTRDRERRRKRIPAAPAVFRQGFRTASPGYVLRIYFVQSEI